MVPGVSRGSQCPCGPCAYCDVVRHKEMDEKVVVVAVPVRTDKDKIPRALKDTLTVMTDRSPKSQVRWSTLSSGLEGESVVGEHAMRILLQAVVRLQEIGRRSVYKISSKKGEKVWIVSGLF